MLDLSAVRQAFGTVRLKLTLVATAVVSLVLAGSAFGLVAVQQNLLTHGIDEQLTQRADNIEARVVTGVVERFLDEGDPEDSFVQVVGRRGGIVAASSNAEGLGPAARAVPDQVADRITTESDVLPGNGRFRVLTRPVESRGAPVTLVVAKNLDDVEESVGILRTSLAIAIPVAIALLAGLVWWLTGRALRPVEEIRAEVESMKGTELDRRVPTPGGDDEISRLARTMNEMLERVETATERQRRFVADASHELRGPLTRIRAALEVAIAHPDLENPGTVHRSVLTDTVDLQKLVDDLLFLAQSESGELPPSGDAVDLDDLVLDEARRLNNRGTVRVDASAVSAARTVGDAGQLARAIRNLASNAERHARSTVTFELRECGSRSELVVADDGPGIPAEHHEVVFKRFTRLDEARSRDAGGSGLGLAIVQDIVTRHRGTVAISSTNGSGARFVMDLPRAD